MKLSEAIKKYATQDLIDEIEYKMEECEIGQDEAFMDISDLADEGYMREFLTVTRKILIDAGFYRVIDEDEISRTSCSSGKPWDFSMRKIKYVWCGKQN